MLRAFGPDRVGHFAVFARVIDRGEHGALGRTEFRLDPGKLDHLRILHECAELPTPGVLNVSLPGCDRASAISPLTSRTGTDGCTASANDVVTTMDTGAKSRSTLYGSLGRNAGRMAVEPAA